MMLISYNERSFLKNGTIQFINCFIFLFVLIILINGTSIFFGPSLLLIIFGIPYTLNVCLEKIFKDTICYLRENNRKGFLISYTIVCAVVSTTLLINTCSLITECYLHGISDIFVLRAFISLFLAFNIINIPSLFHFILEDYLKK